MFPLFLLFVLMPILEVAVLIRVGGLLGFWPTLGFIIGIGLVGAWFAKREGRRTFWAVQTALSRGEMPTNEILEGFLIFAGGLLMITPGFVTDVMGLLFVMPGVRKILLRVIRNYAAQHLQVRTVVFHSTNVHSAYSEPMKDVTPNAQKLGSSGD